MTPANDPNTAGTTTLKILFSKLPSLPATEEVNVVLRCSKLHFNGNDAQGESASPRIYPIIFLLNLHGLYGWGRCKRQRLHKHYCNQGKHHERQSKQPSQQMHASYRLSEPPPVFKDCQ